MLGKLIKHDFRALSRTLFPLQIGILGGGLAAALFTTLNLRISESAMSADGLTFFRAAILGAGTLITGLIAICIAASAVVTLVLICVHFYRNLMDREGYLTFTLPVGTGRIVWSKLITGMLWSIINLAVICLTILLFAVFGTGSQGFMNMNVLAELREMLSSLLSASKDAGTMVVVIELIVLAIVTLAVLLLKAYFAITVGSRAQKNRLLASVGMYIVLSIGINILATIAALVVSIGSFSALVILESATSQISLFHRVAWICIAMEALLGAGFYFGTCGLLKNRLNLQ